MTKTEYEEAIKAAKIVVVDFQADWCPPCKDLSPRLDTELKAFPDYKLIKIDVDSDDPEISKTLNIRSIPTLITYLDGFAYDRVTGNQTSEQLKKFLIIPKPPKDS